MIDINRARPILIAVGISAKTYLKGNIIIKVPRIDDEDDQITEANRKAARNGADIYVLLNKHPSIAVCNYISPSKDYLELEYYPHGTLRDYVNDHRNKITDAALKQWARQMIEGISYLHNKGVRHSDLRLDQWLLDVDWNARLIDFNGSGYDPCRTLGLEGSEAVGMERSSHYMPRDPSLDSTVTSDLFALGSVLYELVVGENPYEGLDDDMIMTLFEQGQFPSVKGLLLGNVIIRSWKMQFVSADDLLCYGKTHDRL